MAEEVARGVGSRECTPWDQFLVEVFKMLEVFGVWTGCLFR